MSGHRPATGSRVDPTHTIRFVFDSRPYTGLAGDTLASALVAAGVGLFGRSFKYHRPRGLLSAGADEPNALVTVVRGGVREPNLPATQVEIFDGLVAESQNRYPSLRFDIGAANRLAGGLIASGFYYKTFMGPAVGPLKGTRFWMLCEKLIRRAAGLGKAGLVAETARHDHVNAFCDVLVVGSGPAGLSAALKAAESGRRVMLAEIDAGFGGSLLRADETIDGIPARDWVQAAVEALARMENVRLMRRTNVWGYYDSNTLAAVERVSDHKQAPATGEPRQRSWTIRAGMVVLATGAIERPIVFPGNDRPGVMLASAGSRLLADYGVSPGRRIAVFTNNDSAYAVAAQLAAAGVEIAAIIDVREHLSPAARALAARAGGDLLPGHAVSSTTGRRALSGVTAGRFDIRSGRTGGEPVKIAADCLLVSGGWSPTIHLASHAGGNAVWNEELSAFLPPARSRGWIGAGAFLGAYDTAAAIDQGRRAGAKAAGMPAPRGRMPAISSGGLDPAPAPVFEIGGDGTAFVDFQHDVTAEDIRLAHREGFISVEHLKRYTTLGMATDQGKASNVAGLAIMAAARGIGPAEAGTTRFRPPFAPVAMGAIAGDRPHRLRADRLTPLHDWHVENGARMFPSGLWHRPQVYALAGETVEQAYIREARAVRASVGIVDVSTIGKIAVQGPDAATLLDRVYTNIFSTLPVGRARYGLMLRDDGHAFDDGTTWRLADNDFLMTTTTANAGGVMQHLEYLLDIAWPELKVNVTSVTDQWAGAAVAGPRSRDVLMKAVEGAALDNASLPVMGIVHGRIDGAPVMICRLSFSGELAYEVYCGAGHATAVWEALIDAGSGFGIVPYGLEALGTLRIEKGHVTGAEIDGRTTARDLHLDWMLSRRKPFVGSPMMDREGMTGEGRLQLVGLVSLDGRPAAGGAHVVEGGSLQQPGESIGHVTAFCYSPALSRYIALALVRGGAARYGTRAFASDPLRGRFGPVEIVSHHFFDPDGSRMHG